jgi:hypothetical protein
MSLHRVFAVALSGAALALAAPAAHAASMPSGCAELQSTINTASSHANHGEGEVVVLNGMCDAANLKSTAGVAIPAESNISIEGAAGTTSGFDGAGVTAPLLHSASFETVGNMTLRNLTFQHANVTTTAGSALRLQIAHLTLTHDAFIENTLHGGLGGAAFVFLTATGKSPSCSSASTFAGITVTGSVFRANKLVSNNFANGGALSVAQLCALPGSVFEDNAFEGNTIEFSGSGEALGGAMSFESGGEELPAPVTQRRNVFDSNRILATSSTTNYGGGGEWLEGASLTSTDERFSRNSIPGTATPKWSWGGGLAILNTGCNAVTPTESTLENAVVAGNSIGSGTPSAIGGAGIYVGCSPSTTNPNHLSLLDSTVTRNSVASGGIAGVDGHPGDQLRIANSILAGDSGGDEIGGFNGAGGSLSAAFSDVCAAGGVSPLAGEGNICANPLLIDNGDPSSFDVRETTTSPTIDAGSNALVPSALASDFYGNPRLLSARSFIPPCMPGATVGPTLYPAIVDMGASEFGPAAVPAYTIACGGMIVLPERPRAATFAFPSIGQRPSGQLALRLRGVPTGHVSVLATFKLNKRLIKTVKGRRRVTHKLETVTYGRLSYTSVSAQDVTKLLKPTKRALALLKRRRHLQVRLLITLTPPGGAASSKTKTITVTYKAPSRKRHR